MHRNSVFLIEAKWKNVATDACALHSFQGKVRERMEGACSLYVSYAGFTPTSLRDFTAKRILLMGGIGHRGCAKPAAVPGQDHRREAAHRDRRAEAVRPSARIVSLIDALMRMLPEAVSAVVELAGFRRAVTDEVPPCHMVLASRGRTHDRHEQGRIERTDLAEIGTFLSAKCHCYYAPLHRGYLCSSPDVISTAIAYGRGKSTVIGAPKMMKMRTGTSLWKGADGS